VLGVVAAREVRIDAQLPQRDDPQALALEPRQDFAGEPPLEGVGLDQDEGSRCDGQVGSLRSRLYDAQEAVAGLGRSSPGPSRAGGEPDPERPDAGFRFAVEAWREAEGRA